MDNDKLRALHREILKEPIRRTIRPRVVQYVLELSTQASLLAEEDLAGTKGHSIAMDICGALGFQTADGVDHDNWLNQKDEPILSDILAVSSILDFDSDNRNAWKQFFNLTSALRDQ